MSALQQLQVNDRGIVYIIERHKNKERRIDLHTMHSNKLRLLAGLLGIEVRPGTDKRSLLASIREHVLAHPDASIHHQ